MRVSLMSGVVVVYPERISVCASCQDVLEACDLALFVKGPERHLAQQPSARHAAGRRQWQLRACAS